MLLDRREDVEDATSHRDLAATLHQVDPLVTEHHQALDHIREHEFVAGLDQHRFHATDLRDHRLHESANRGDHDVDGPNATIRFVGASDQTVHDGDSSSDGVGRWRQTLMRKGLPRREHCARQTRDQLGQNGLEVFSLATRRRHDERGGTSTGLQTGDQVGDHERMKGRRCLDHGIGGHSSYPPHVGESRIGLECEKQPGQAHELAASRRALRR